MTELLNTSDCQLAKKVMDTVENVILVMNQEGIILRFNRAAEILTGYHAEDMINNHWSILIPESERKEVEGTLSELQSKNLSNSRINHWVRQDGQQRTLKWQNSTIADEQGNVRYIVATGLDITEQVKIHENLAISAKALETGEGLVITDHNGVIIRTNKVFTQLTGYSEAEAIGKTPSLLSSGRHDRQFYEAMWEGISERGFWAGEIWNKRKNGEIYPEYLKVSAVYNDVQEVTHYVASFTDISNIKNAEQKIQFFANYDHVTGLPNRTYFIKLLRKTMLHTQRNTECLILLHIRLNKLSKLNTQLGLEVTDGLLTEFTHKMDDCIQDYEAFAGRTSGSDFTLVIHDLKTDGAIQLAKEIAEKILAVGHMISTDEPEHSHYLDPRIGIYIHSSEESDKSESHAETLIEHGLLSSFEAIDQDKHIHFYSQTSQKIAEDSYKLEQALSNASRSMEEFELFHQPQYDRQNRIIGGEALIRWKHCGSYIPPNVFIPFAEKSGLMLQIGHWVLQNAIKQFLELQSRGLTEYYRIISVNLSTKQLMSDKCMQHIKELLDANPEITSHLKLEITETSFIEDIDTVKQRIQHLRSLGLKVSIDDFGTGYSSLSYLTELEFDEIKIDKSFIDMVHVPAHKAHKITKSILGIVKALEVRVIAEGVETKEQMNTLMDLECQFFQGYLLSKPLPFDQLIQLLEETAKTAALPQV